MTTVRTFSAYFAAAALALAFSLTMISSTVSVPSAKAPANAAMEFVA